MPEVAAEVFRKCTKDNGLRPEDKGYMMEFDYSFLDDTYVEYRPETNPHLSPEDSKSLLSNADYYHGASKDVFDNFYDDTGHLLEDSMPYTHVGHSFICLSEEIENDCFLILQNSDIAKLSHPLMLMVRWQRQELLSHPLVRSLLRYQSQGYLYFYCNEEMA